jgi:hypothetical protein
MQLLQISYCAWKTVGVPIANLEDGALGGRRLNEVLLAGPLAAEADEMLVRAERGAMNAEQFHFFRRQATLCTAIP